jgi:hypothetical protein
MNTRTCLIPALLLAAIVAVPSSLAYAEDSARDRVKATGLLQALRSERGLLIQDRLDRSLADLDRAVAGIEQRAHQRAAVRTSREQNGPAPTASEDLVAGAGRTPALPTETVVQRDRSFAAVAEKGAPVGIQQRAQACFERRLRADATTEGRIELEIHFDDNAEVKTASIQTDSTEDGELRTCVIDAVISAASGHTPYAGAAVSMAFNFRKP